MKILWLSHVVPYPPKAGVLIRSFFLLSELSRHFDIDLLAFNQSGLLNTYFRNKQDALPSSIAALRAYCDQVRIESIPAERHSVAKYGCAFTSLFSRLPYTVRWLSSDSYRRTLEEMLAAERYDLIHVDTESLAQYKPSSFTGPLALDHHNVESHMLLRRADNERNPVKRLYFRQEGRRLREYERRTLPMFRTHIVCSDQDRDRLREIEPSLDIHVSPNGMHFPDEPPLREPEANVVRLLFAGGLSWYPNRDAMHHFLDDIWPALGCAIPNIHLDIIGKMPSEKIVASARSDARIHVHGYVDDLEPYYRKATAYVCPIRDGGGTKLKMVDALSNAIPVIAHPIACEGIEVIDGESVLLARSADEYVSHLRRLIADPAWGVTVGESGFRAARARYSASSIADNLAAHYKALIRSP